jgi:hypothetical protein
MSKPGHRIASDATLHVCKQAQELVRDEELGQQFLGLTNEQTFRRHRQAREEKLQRYLLGRWEIGEKLPIQLKKP